MATERERFEEIAAKLRDEDLDFVLRTEQISAERGDRRRYVIGVFSLIFGMIGLVVCAEAKLPWVGMAVYLGMVFGVSPAFEHLCLRHGDRALRRWF
jgi:hypothetical protein